MAKIQGQLENAQLENKSSDYSAGVQGRTWWNYTTGQQKVDDGTNIRAVLRNDAKAIIGNSGTAAENTRLHRGAAGVLQFVEGDDATSEGTLSTSLNQISSRTETYTTAGRPSFGNTGRVIYNSDTSTLQVDTGAAWGDVAPAAGSIAVTSKTANYTLLTSDGVVLGDSSGGAFNLTLPTAVGNAGKVFYLKKTTSDFTAITIDTTSSQTIDGVTTRKLHTQYEAWSVVSDGSNWQVLEHKALTPWTSATPSASMTNATLKRYFWRRVGDTIHIQASWKWTGAGSVSNHNEDEWLPPGLTVDQSKMAYTETSLDAMVGIADVLDTGTQQYYGFVKWNQSATQFYINNQTGSNPFTPGNTDEINILIQVPITGWEG